MPKKLWADLHIIPDHHIDTHGAFHLFMPPLAFYIYIFIFPTLPHPRSFSSSNAAFFFFFSPLSRAVCLHPNENIGKGYACLGGLVKGSVVVPSAPEHRWRGARGPAGSYPSTWPALHSEGSGWYYATCPHTMATWALLIIGSMIITYAHDAELDISGGGWLPFEHWGCFSARNRAGVLCAHSLALIQNDDLCLCERVTFSLLCEVTKADTPPRYQPPPVVTSFTTIRHWVKRHPKKQPKNRPQRDIFTINSGAETISPCSL